MIAILGVLLLLVPGTCALIFTGGSVFDRDLIGLWAIWLVLSAIALLLLYAAIWGKWNGGNR
jgi:hypothetical protein